MKLKKASPFLITFLSLCATACASSKPLPLNPEMTCTEIQAQIDKTRMSLYNEKTSQGGEAPAIAGTAADVAVTGAGMAGVPYVGGVYSIGRAILGHRSRTATSEADLYQIHLDELNYLAQRKDCNL